MSKPRNKLIYYKNKSFRKTHGFTTAIHFGKQAKHFPYHSEYVVNKSQLIISITQVQYLVEHYAGTGQWRGKNKEIVNFGVIIGKYKDQKTSEWIYTSWGTIHYSKNGAHLVPRAPKDK